MFLKHAVDRILAKHFFKPEPAQSLSLFRFLYCTALLSGLLNSWSKAQALYAGGTWYPVPLFEVLQLPLMPVEWFALVFWLLAGTLTLTSLGCWTHLSAALSCLLYFLYKGTLLGFSKSPHSHYVVHSDNIVVMILFILALAPGTAVWGIDGLRQRNWQWRLPDRSQGVVSAWPSQLIKLTLGLAYFGAGYCKVINSPLWADGCTLQSYLMQKYMLQDIALSYELAQHYWLCLLLSVLTLILELTFWTVVFFPRLTWVYVVGGLSFHYMIKLTMGIDFFVPFGLTYLIFLDWPTLCRLTTCLRLRRTGPLNSRLNAERNVGGNVVGRNSWSRACVLGLAGMLLGCILVRVEAWPFTDYRVFEHRRSYDQIKVYRVAGIDFQGQRQWLPERELKMESSVARNMRFQGYLAKSEYAAIVKVLQKIARELPLWWFERCCKLVVIERSFEQSPEGRFRIIDRSLVEISLANQQQPWTSTCGNPSGNEVPR